MWTRNGTNHKSSSLWDTYYLMDSRLLYVACTRAQSLLYLMFAKARVVGGKMQNKQLSKFVSAVSNKNPVGLIPAVGHGGYSCAYQGVFYSWGTPICTKWPSSDIQCAISTTSRSGWGRQKARWTVSLSMPVIKVPCNPLLITILSNRKINHDFILPNYTNVNGEWKTMTLTGEKSSNHGISDSGIVLCGSGFFRFCQFDFL